MHIIGASGHAKVIMDILQLNNHSILNLWDDNPDLLEFNNHLVGGTISDFKKLPKSSVIVAIGNNKIRKEIVQKLDAEFGIAIHPSSVCAVSAIVKEGTVLMANSTVNPDAYIGRHVIVNTNASVDHDCKINDFVHISPHAGLAGNVTVGEGTHIGIGANIIQGIIIGKWATIGAGAVIINNVPDYAVVVGNPGRIIKYNK